MKLVTFEKKALLKFFAIDLSCTPTISLGSSIYHFWLMNIWLYGNDIFFSPLTSLLVYSGACLPITGIIEISA